MATTNQERVQIIASFDGGMQRRSTKFLRKLNELRFAKNADFQNKIGGVSKALGYERLGGLINSGSDVLGAGSLNTSTDVNKIVAFSGTDAYVWNSVSDAWDAQSRSFTASQKFETERFLDMLFEVNGITDAPQTYTGAAWSTTTNVTDMPKARYIREYNSRLYLFNISIPVGGNFPSRVWFSDLPKNNAITWGFESNTDLATTSSSAVVTSAGSLFITRNIKVGDPFFITTGSDIGEYEVKSIDSETQITLTANLTSNDSSINFWVGGNWFDVARDNSDIGKGLGKNSDRLLCFKRHSLHRFQKGTDAFTDSLVKVEGVPGTTSQRSIVDLRGWTFYWTDSGLWKYDGNTSTQISSSIQDIIDGMDKTNLSKIVGWTTNERVVKMFIGTVYIAAEDLTISNVVVCYDALSEIWWFESISDVIHARTDWLIDEVLNQFTFSSGGQAYYSQGGNTFNQSAINMEIETAFYFPISPEVLVTMSRFRTYTENGQGVTALYKFAYSNGRVDADWKPLDLISRTKDEQNWKPKETEPRASGWALKILESSTTNARPVLERIACYYSGWELR